MGQLSKQKKFMATPHELASGVYWKICKVETNQVIGVFQDGLFTARISSYSMADLLELHDLFLQCKRTDLGGVAATAGIQDI